MNNNPFLSSLGVEILQIGNGCSMLALDLREPHMNSWNIVHGGVLMSLLDVAMAQAGRALHADLIGVVTLEMKTSFLQPGGKIGQRLIAQGHAFHQSTTMCFCEAEIKNGERLIAKAMGTFKYLRGAKAQASIQKLCGSAD